MDSKKIHVKWYRYAIPRRPSLQVHWEQVLLASHTRRRNKFYVIRHNTWLRRWCVAHDSSVTKVGGLRTSRVKETDGKHVSRISTGRLNRMTQVIIIIILLLLEINNYNGWFLFFYFFYFFSYLTKLGTCHSAGTVTIQSELHGSCPAIV